MFLEPACSEPYDFLHGAGFWEEVGRAGNDRQTRQPREARERALIELDNLLIALAYDQQGRRLDAFQRIMGKIGPAAARNNGANAILHGSSGDQGSSCSRAGTEQSDRQVSKYVVIQPADRIGQTIGEQRNIEHPPSVIRDFLRGPQQVEQKRRKSHLIERAGHLAVADTEAAGTGTVRKHHHPACRGGNGQQPGEMKSTDLHDMRCCLGSMDNHYQ